MEFNYATLSVPIVIASTFSRGRSAEKSAENPRRIRSLRDRTENLRYLKCILNLVTMRFLSKFAESYIGYNWLDQNFVLSFQIYSTFAVNAQLIILEDGTDSEFSASSQSRLRHEYKAFVNSNSAYYFMPTFWVQRNTLGDLRGWFYCWYCGLLDPFVPFRCSALESCPMNMVDIYDHTVQQGKNIRWLVRQDGGYVHLKRRTICPPERTLDDGCIPKEPESVFEFLSDGLNLTSSLDAPPQSHSSMLPYITYAEVAYYRSPAYILETGVRSEFRFITSQRLKEQDGGKLGTLAKPFQAGIWACLGATVVAFTFTMTALTGYSPHTCPFHVIGACSMLLDQPRHWKQRTRTVVPFTTAYRMALGSWLLPILAIGITYKAMVKSSRMLETTYETELKTLIDLQGFTLFFLHKFEGRSRGNLSSWMLSCGKDKDTVSEVHEREKYPMDCEAEFYRQKCETWLFYLEGVRNLSFCSAMQTYNVALYGNRGYNCSHRTGLLDQGREDKPLNTEDGQKIFYLWFCKYSKVMRKLLQHVRVRNETDLENVLRNELDAPETALVLPRFSFDGTWEKVRRFMRKTRTKFASNIQTKYDQVLSVAPRYKISSGFGFDSKNALLWRAKVLMESGLYVVWKRWEEHRGRAKKLAGNMLAKYSKFMALSLSNSDFPIIFHMYLYCLCAALVCLIIECRRMLHIIALAPNLRKTGSSPAHE